MGADTPSWLLLSCSFVTGIGCHFVPTNNKESWQWGCRSCGCNWIIALYRSKWPYNSCNQSGRVAFILVGGIVFLLSLMVCRPCHTARELPNWTSSLHYEIPLCLASGFLQIAFSPPEVFIISGPVCIVFCLQFNPEIGVESRLVGTGSDVACWNAQPLIENKTQGIVKERGGN